MSTIPYNPTEVSALRKEASLYGVKLLPTPAWELLRKVKDRGLAIDALLMAKRPGWLEEIVGPKEG